MQVVFERSGGFSGLLVTISVDTTKLTVEQAEQLHRLVESAHFFSLPAHLPAPAQPDRFQYQVTVETDGRQHTVTISEAAVPETLRPLISWLMEFGHRN